MKKKTSIIVLAVAVGAAILGISIYFATKSSDDTPPAPDPFAAHPTYVFELVRHGARAPLLSANDFPVGAEMLTPQGMRQRYLLGRYNA